MRQQTDVAADLCDSLAWRRQSRLDVPALPLGLEAAAPLTAISVRHALSLSGKGSDPGRCA